MAAATDLFVLFFETTLSTQVSPTKSLAVAGRPVLAQRLASATRVRRLVAKRSVKMLGASFAGGRRRSVGVLRTRLLDFKRRVPRFQAMRRMGVDARALARSTAAPSMLYGVDLVGASCTHLHAVRVATLQAALPPGAARNTDIAFTVLAARGALPDPAVEAHAAPLRHWGLARW